MSAMSPPRIVGISESPDGWEILLEVQHKARVTLSPDFHVLTAELINGPKP
jgi:hypothetical protein